MNVPYESYIAIYNWMNHKSLKNFYILYRDGFLFNHLWSRPLWRCWRILRNTHLNNRYHEVLADEDMRYFYIEKGND